MQTAYWKTGDGEKIRICDMENRHLINTIRYLERKASEKTKKTGKPFEDVVRTEYWLFLDELEDRIENEKIIGFVIEGNKVFVKRM